MPVVLFVLIKLVVEAIRSALRKTRPVKPQPLCAGCSNAHVQYGAEGRRAISCTFGGMVRPCHVGRVVLHRLPRPQSQDWLRADRVCTGGPGQPSRSVEMLPERLSAPLGEGLRTDGVSGGGAVSRRRVTGAPCPRDRRQVPGATGSASAGATVLLPVWVVIGLAGPF
jgi:hypothetical protein